MRYNGCNLSYRPPEERPAFGRPQLFHELRQLIGDAPEEELQGLLDFFHVVAAERAAEARRALQCGDLETLQRAGHTLRSMGAGIGAWDLAGVASRLEDWAATQLEQHCAPAGREAIELVQIIENELVWIQKAAQTDPA